jgi:parvulin-like peptidyl-prolyl cis-trans isomerase-like protein
MRKSWLLCVLLGTLAWGQAQPGTTPAQPSPAQAPSAASKTPEPAAVVPENAVVLTIKGVCPAAPKTPAASKTGAAKTAATPAKKPADCKTEITRAQFEKIASGLSPTVTPQLKRQLEQALPRFMAMSEAAKAKGLDKSPRFVETMKIAKMQILTTELQRTVQEETDKVPATEVAAYYKKNPEAYEQYSLDRLFVPRYKQAVPDEKDESKEPEKLTDEQQKAKEAADKAKQEQGEQEMNKLADTLRARGAAGEDFAKLQKEAFEAAGTKVDNPTVNLPKVRRTGLPPAHAAVFDLKAGEVSQVISDNGGHYVYKVVSKDTLPLDQVKDEIHNKLKSEHMKEIMDKYTNSFQAVPNEVYFGPAAAPAGPAGMRQGPPPHMPRPQMATPPTQPQTAPPAANPPAQPPAAAAPPSKPN